MTVLCAKYSIMNHARIFCKPCLTFCEISLLVKFSRIVFKNVEKAAISFPTFVWFDVCTGDVLSVPICSSIDI